MNILLDTARDEIQNSSFIISDYFTQPWHNLIFPSKYRVKNAEFLHPSPITSATSHTDIHKYTQTLPLTDKLG